ncbi:MAG: zinc ribbon domain-containing protein [Butyrivibrio sp.]|nr:zinc ribbon domain-containing protein [Butyrivibrio sp.]
MKICPNCGNMLEDEVHFCINCGKNLEDTVQTEAEEVSKNAFEPDEVQEPVKKGSEPPVKFVIAAIVVLAAGIIGIIAFIKIIGFRTQRFTSYQQDIISDRFLNGLEKLGDTVSTDSFSSDITITAQSDTEQLNEYLNGSSVILKMQADNSEKKF